MALTDDTGESGGHSDTGTDRLDVGDMALRPLAPEELSGVNGPEEEPEPLREAIIKGKVPGEDVGPEIRAEIDDHFYYKGEVVHRDELDGQRAEQNPDRAPIHTWENTVKGPALDEQLSAKIHEDTGPQLRSAGLNTVFGNAMKGADTAYRNVNADPQGPDVGNAPQPDAQFELQRAMQMSPPPPPSPPTSLMT